GPDSVKLWDSQTGKELATFSGGPMAFSAVAFSPNNPRLVAGDHQGNLTIIDTKLLRLETTIPSGIPWIRSISFSPDGSFLGLRALPGLGRGGALEFSSGTSPSTQ